MKLWWPLQFHQGSYLSLTVPTNTCIVWSRVATWQSDNCMIHACTNMTVVDSSHASLMNVHGVGKCFVGGHAVIFTHVSPSTKLH